MTQRITQHMLDAQANRLNTITNSPATQYTRDSDGKLRANIGNFHISYQNGGACLHRMSNEGGGVTTPALRYHAPKRLAYDIIDGFIEGVLFKA